jgi:hypothetical protein
MNSIIEYGYSINLTVSLFLLAICYNISTLKSCNAESSNSSLQTLHILLNP